eukprot:scaffold19766_cov122-Isochrysis_galbana.AAC.4
MRGQTGKRGGGEEKSGRDSLGDHQNSVELLPLCALYALLRTSASVQRMPTALHGCYGLKQEGIQKESGSGIPGTS